MSESSGQMGGTLNASCVEALQAQLSNSGSVRAPSWASTLLQAGATRYNQYERYPSNVPPIEYNMSSNDEYDYNVDNENGEYDVIYNSFTGKYMYRKKHNKISRDQSRISQEERDFANNPNNFKNANVQKKILETLEAGDKAQKEGNIYHEGYYHRTVQEEIEKAGYEKNKESREAYAWNCLNMHNPVLISELLAHGYTLQESFYYDSRTCRYYVKDNVRLFLDLNNILYKKIGTSSIVYVPQK